MKKFGFTQLVEHCRTTIATDKVIAGVSGGVDSMVLLHALRAAGKKIEVIHVNYHTRVPGSDQDENLVYEYCQQYGLKLTVISADQKNQTGNFQEWARSVRHQAFEEAHIRTGDPVALGHHADDLVETQLMKWMKGKDLIGQSGYSRSYILLPLKSLSKQTIREISELEDIPFNEDKSNQSNEYLRNRLRNEIIPTLKETVPDLVHNAVIFDQISNGYQQLVEYGLAQATDNGGSLKRDEWLNQPTELQYLMIHHWVLVQTGHSTTFKQLKTVDAISKLSTGQTWTINADWEILRDRDLFVCHKKLPEEPEEKYITVLPYEIGDLRFAIDSPESQDWLTDSALFLALTDDDLPLTIRTWKPGDRIQPLGMKGHKKVQDVLTDEKVPSQYRNQGLVIETDKIIAAVIFPPQVRDKIGIIGESFRCKPNQPAIKISRL